MAHVLIHLNVQVPNKIAERSEAEAVEVAKHRVAGQPLGVGLPDFEKLVVLAEVVDYDD